MEALASAHEICEEVAELLETVRAVGATHIITHIEADPASEGATWTWDSAWALLSRNWDGVLLGVMFDSAFEWIAAKARLLAAISPRFMVVDICMPMEGSMKRGRPEVGPVNMPVSRESLALVDARLADVSPTWDVSFIGVMYPYRMDLVDRLRANGVSVAINPHRADAATHDAGSRVNQPSWLDYMAGLASSRMTLNFSQSSAGRFEQLKTRVLEATLAGTLLLTDDLDRTRRFWVPGEEYVYFRDVAALPRVISDLLADPDRVMRIAAAGQRNARALAHTNFWGGIDDGLRRRGLPLTGFSESVAKG
jgi:glycosyltransferase involved in cell wall biosynthesis